MKTIISTLFAVAFLTALSLTQPASAGMSFKGTAVSEAASSLTLIKGKKSCAEKNEKCLKKAKGKEKKLKKCARKLNKCEMKKAKKSKKGKKGKKDK